MNLIYFNALQTHAPSALMYIADFVTANIIYYCIYIYIYIYGICMYYLYMCTLLIIIMMLLYYMTFKFEQSCMMHSVYSLASRVLVSINIVESYS